MRKPHSVAAALTLAACLTATGLTGTATAATLPLPPAPASMAVTGTAVPGPLGVDLTTGSTPILSHQVTLAQPEARTKAIAALKRLRGEMYDQNEIWFEGVPLRDYLSTHGVTSKKQYQNAVAWDSNLERIAMQRNVESRVYQSHDRPDGGDTWSACYMGVCANGEILAWGYDDVADAIMRGWGYGELAALNAAQGYFNHDNGHLHLLLDPSRNTWGFADFDGVASGEASTGSTADPNSTGLNGPTTLYFAAPTSVQPSLRVSGPPNITVGTTDTYSVTSSLTPQGYGFYGTFASSNPKVLTITRDGRAIARAVGTAVVTATSNGTKFTMQVTVRRAVTNGWLRDGNRWYWMEAGTKAKGWRSIGGTWYYFDPSSTVMRTGWVATGGTWYYLQANGAMATGWIKDSGTWHYLQANGAMATGWCWTDGRWSLFAASGAWIGYF